MFCTRYSVFHFGDMKMYWQNLWLAWSETRASCEKSTILGLWFSVPPRIFRAEESVLVQIKLSSEDSKVGTFNLTAGETRGQAGAILRIVRSITPVDGSSKMMLALGWLPPKVIRMCQCMQYLHTFSQKLSQKIPGQWTVCRLVMEAP